MNIEELIKKAEQFNIEQIRKYNPDMEHLHDLSFKAAMKLAKEIKRTKKL